MFLSSFRFSWLEVVNKSTRFNHNSNLIKMLYYEWIISRLNLTRTLVACNRSKWCVRETTWKMIKGVMNLASKISRSKIRWSDHAAFDIAVLKSSEKLNELTNDGSDESILTQSNWSSSKYNRVTGRLIHRREIEQKIKEDHPSWGKTAINVEVSRCWNKLSMEEKRIYREKHRQQLDKELKQ